MLLLWELPKQKVEATSNELPANEEVKEEEVPLALTEEQEETPSIVVNEEATSSLNLDEKSSIAPPTVIENKEAEVLNWMRSWLLLQM